MCNKADVSLEPRTVMCRMHSSSSLLSILQKRATGNTDMLSVSLDIVERLAADPQEAMQESAHAQVALHLACKHGAHVTSVRALIDAYPKGVSKRDAFGWLPLHLACKHGASPEVVGMLLDAHPEGATQPVGRQN
eukprot:3426499-Prymnesium_polylepis.1